MDWLTVILVLLVLCCIGMAGTVKYTMAKIKSKIHADAVIEIAGAGVAGLAAAITLAQAGRQVRVYEVQKKVGYRFGGDFQGLENWTTRKNALRTLNAPGIATDFTTVPCCNGIAFDPAGKRYEIDTDEPLFYLVKRGSGSGTLDDVLLRQTQSLGVEVYFNSRLRQMAGDGILAAGPKAADAIAVGYHFETDMENGYWVICDDELAPRGYVYLLVMNGRGTVKSGMFSGFKRERQFPHSGQCVRRPASHGRGAGRFSGYPAGLRYASGHLVRRAGSGS